MKFSEMPYERVQDSVLSDLDGLTARFRAASSAGEQEQIYLESQELWTHVLTMQSICYIRTTIDTTDEFYEKEQEHYDQLEPLLTEKQQEFAKALCASPFRKELEQKWGTLLFENAERLPA